MGGGVVGAAHHGYPPIVAPAQRGVDGPPGRAGSLPHWRRARVPRSRGTGAGAHARRCAAQLPARRARAARGGSASLRWRAPGSDCGHPVAPRDPPGGRRPTAPRRGDPGVVTAPALSPAVLDRFARHVALDEIPPAEDLLSAEELRQWLAA